MCNLYDVGPNPNEGRFRWEAQVRDAIGNATYVAPGKPGFVVRLVEGQHQVAAMQWGFSRPWSKRPINNARDDKLEGKTWKEAWQARRCVIPARRFFEWSGSSRPKTRHAICVDPDHWFWIAGIWEDNPDPQIGLSYTMLTTAANAEMSPIHDRMPVILPPDDIEEFLLSPEAPANLVRPFDGDLIIDPPVA